MAPYWKANPKKLIQFRQGAFRSCGWLEDLQTTKVGSKFTTAERGEQFVTIPGMILMQK
ncbi:hypothetical protein HOLleu_27942 [Holothuria leucospilota]|uniref:Uncharacterized protein n=1 Tax=Holothuria leucospilota TaxID=206669 RepID=A0A9Q1BRF0_HOLLE|nr:hypothetical protein HOLleu_27942 [Holothuria leucospilota]